MTSLTYSPGMAPSPLVSKFTKLYIVNSHCSCVDYGFGSTTPVAGETLRDYRIQRSFSRILTKLTVKVPFEMRFIHNSLTRVRQDEGISNRIWRIRYFLAPPAELMYPAVLFRVAWEAFQEAIDLMFGSIFPYA